MSHFRVFAALACALFLAACVRTDDGSVVPKYQMTMVRTGWFLHPAWRRTITNKRQIHDSEFLPPPPPPEQAAAERPKTRHHIRKEARRRRPHHQFTQRKPAAEPDASTPELKCHKVVLDTGKSRVRCD
ncbi:MAG: hypothetical protein ACTHJV_12315 [Rhizobiaceae bacterium]